MRALVPDEWIEDRHRPRLDRRDEGWRLVEAVDGDGKALIGLGVALRTAGERFQVRTEHGVEEV